MNPKNVIKMINIHKITLKFKCVPWNESVHYFVYVQINQPIMIYLKKVILITFSQFI